MENETIFCFLISAGRSGSTLLYKLLSLHPDIGYINNIDVRLQPWIPTGYIDRIFSNSPKIKRRAWFDKKGRAYINRKMIQKTIPSPTEGEEIYARSGVPLFINRTSNFDKDMLGQLRKNFLKMSKEKAKKIFLSKRIPNVRRLPLIKEAFPEAKFIHLIRDGRAVARSITQVHWWKNEIMLWWAGKTLGELISDGEDYLEVTAQTWVEAEKWIGRHLATVKPENQLTVHYEELLRDPKMTIDEILKFLHLSMEKKYWKTIESLNLSPMPDKWKEFWTEKEMEKVDKIQREMLIFLGYE